MIEVFVIIVLAALLGYKEYSSRKERENLLDVIVSKDAGELANLKVAKKVKPKMPPNTSDDLVPIDELNVDSKEFKEILKRENG